jgi:EmrB/QacA subfamily drug resistance transporter
VSGIAIRQRRRSGPVLALLAFAQFIIAVDYNIVYVALPDIGRELGFTAGSLQWVVSAYAVGFGGFLLFGGRAVDRLGQRRVFVTALVVYAVSSLGGGLATDPVVLVVARVVQGLGGALLTPATLALINTIFPEGPARNRALGVWGATGSSGLAAGALLGGVLTNYVGWEWVFFVNVPLALLALVAVPRLLAADDGHERGAFDVPGALLATAGSTLLVLGLVTGPEAGWWSVSGVGSLAAGGVVLGVFVLVEHRSADPLAPLRLFRNRTLASAMAVILVYQSTLGGTYYLFTTYTQNVRGYGALEAGLAFLPLTVASMIAAGRLVPLLIGRWGIRVTLFAGMAGTGGSVAVLVAGMSAGGSFWAVLPGLVLFGVTAGSTFVAMFVAASSGVHPREQGVASSIATTCQQIGGALGLALLVAIATQSAPAAVDGLRIAGWAAAAATVAGAFFALAAPGRKTSR